MIDGDLVKVYGPHGKKTAGIGIFLGLQPRGITEGFYSIWWKGRIATFDPGFWVVKVITAR